VSGSNQKIAFALDIPSNL